MKHRIAITSIIFALIVVLCFTSCDPNTAANTEDTPETTDEVFIPEFFEGSSKAIDMSGLDDDQKTLLGNYTMFPPFNGFKTGSFKNGHSIHTTIAGLPIDLVASKNSDGSYTFEGSRDGDYLKITTSNKTKKYSFVHVFSFKAIDVSVQEYDVYVISGSGTIKGNGFEGVNQIYGRVYTHNLGGTTKVDTRFSYVSYGSGTKSGAFVYLAGEVDNDFDLPEGGFSVDNYEQYINTIAQDHPIYQLHLYDGSTVEYYDGTSLSDCQTYISSEPGYENWVLAIPAQ